MKKLIYLLLPVMLLTGCAPSYRIENQAHAVSMGIDYDEEKIIVCVQVPNLGSPVGKQTESASSSYQIYSSAAADFETAYNILQATLPQQLNLTHLKSVVFSKAFAESERFHETIETFMNVFLITGSAAVIVTEKQAKTLIENQKPHIGIRLSITIPSMLSYHAQNGFIPSLTLSGLYAGLKGRYSTALCALADTADGTYESDSNEEFMPGSLNRTGDNKNEYMGAAVFGREKMVGCLNGRDMQMCYFLMGNANRIADFTEPYKMRISTRKKRDVNIRLNDDQVDIRVTLFLDIATLDDQMDLLAIEKSLKEDFQNVIHRCQTLKVEPFGFASAAVKEFSDNSSFDKFDWLSKFSEANVEISLHLYGEK